MLAEVPNSRFIPEREKPIEVSPLPIDAERYFEVIGKFEELAANPPKGDPYMGAFYKNALHSAYENPQFANLVSGVLKERDITPEHFANLLFRGVQFVELNLLEEHGYPNGLNKQEAWNQELDFILQTKEAELREVLLTRYTTSTIYQRYAGAKSIMSAVFPNREINIADFGCGGNYGLPGISLSEPFKTPVDETTNQAVNHLLSAPLHVKEGLGIDIEDPREDAIKKWRLSCSFYPQELHRLPQVLELEDRLSKAENVNFLKADLLNLPVGYSETQVAPNAYDVVVISTLLYQMSSEKKEEVL